MELIFIPVILHLKPSALIQNQQVLVPNGQTGEFETVHLTKVFKESFYKWLYDDLSIASHKTPISSLGIMGEMLFPFSAQPQFF